MKEINFVGYKNFPLNVYVWDDVSNPVALVQISHGMSEYMGRYDDFAKHLNSKGFVVIGDDHRAHGKSCKCKLGVVEGDCFGDSVEDGLAIAKYAKDTYQLPIILFSHSYGTFLAQKMIEVCDDLYECVVMCGSAKESGADIKVARIVARAQCVFKGSESPARLIKKLSFGAYNKKFKGEKGEFVWGSRNVEKCKEYCLNKYCGFTLSAGFYKSMFDGMKNIYKSKNIKKIKNDLPILLIAGECDPVGKEGKLVKKLYNTYVDNDLKNVEMKFFKDDRHELLNELDNQDVYQNVVEFFEKALKK
ncbi:MAG: alpha/beta hydrolase [Clostridia bacterium]